jgi:hypothetical protein
MFRVQRKRCTTCIYHTFLHWDLQRLEDQVRDPYMGFKGHRICHHSKDACCHGFWDKHKDEFQLGQLAQRLNMVKYVDDDDDAK